MLRQRLYRPSLKITRAAGQSEVSGFRVEVWSPFTGSYQAEDSIETGLGRMDQLAALICQMWLQRHPKFDALTDAPGATGADIAEWAEFRVNPTTARSYDTRRHDRPDWARATGLAQAIETTCMKVGCTPPRAAAA